MHSSILVSKFVIVDQIMGLLDEVQLFEQNRKHQGSTKTNHKLNVSIGNIKSHAMEGYKLIISSLDK